MLASTSSSSSAASIMMYGLSQRRAPMTWHGFLIKRINRIVPLYWLLTTVLLGLMLLLPGLFSGSHLEPVHAMACYSLLPYSDSQDILRPLLVPGWPMT